MSNEGLMICLVIIIGAVGCGIVATIGIYAERIIKVLEQKQ